MNEVSSNRPREALFVRFAAVAKAVAHPLRLALLEQLAQGEHCVQQLADEVGIPFANASQHLQQMLRAGLLVSRRHEKYVIYAVADPAVVQLVSSLRAVAERRDVQVRHLLADYYDELDDLEPMTRAELLKEARRGRVTILDVRSQREFDIAHLPGAVGIPMGELKKRLKELDPAQTVVAYCRGPYCVLAYEAVSLLRQRGFDARRLEGGLPEWRLEGLPLEATGVGPPAP